RISFYWYTHNFYFRVFVQVGFLTGVKCKPVPRGTGNQPLRLPSAGPGLLLDLEIAPSGGSSEGPAPAAYSPCRRCVETSCDVIEYVLSVPDNLSSFILKHSP